MYQQSLNDENIDTFPMLIPIMKMKLMSKEQSGSEEKYPQQKLLGRHSSKKKYWGNKNKLTISQNKIGCIYKKHDIRFFIKKSHWSKILFCACFVSLHQLHLIISPPNWLLWYIFQGVCSFFSGKCQKQRKKENTSPRMLLKLLLKLKNKRNLKKRLRKRKRIRVRRIVKSQFLSILCIQYAFELYTFMHTTYQF